MWDVNDVIVFLGDSARACRPTAMGPCSINDVSFALHRVFFSDQACLTNLCPVAKAVQGRVTRWGLINLKSGNQSLCWIASKYSETLKAE